MSHEFPNYTQIPNIFFDVLLPTLGFNEMRVLLSIYRKTFGWQKTIDYISLSQLEKMTGSSRTHIIESVESLIKKGLIVKKLIGENGNQKTYYEVCFKEIPTSDEESPPQSPEVTPPSDARSPTKETLTKETNTKEDCLLSAEADDEKSKINSRITKNGLDGHEIHFSIDEVFRFAISQSKDWRTNEIQQAWDILEKYTGAIRDPIAYIEGTIKKIRTQQKSEYLNKNGKDTCANKTKDSKNSKNNLNEKKENGYANVLDPDSVTQLYGI